MLHGFAAIAGEDGAPAGRAVRAVRAASQHRQRAPCETCASCAHPLERANVATHSAGFLAFAAFLVLRIALAAPVIAAGGFFSPTAPLSITDAAMVDNQLKLAKFILEQGPKVAATPWINGMPSIAEVLKARAKASASEASTSGSSA